jgi:hypothetical protein
VNYESIKALNWSSLKNIHDSPKHYKYWTEHKKPAKAAYALGSAVHVKVLEPEKFDSQYALCGMVRNENHEKFQAWMDEHPGCVAISPKEMEIVEQTAKSLREHRIAGPILAKCRKEESITWVDPLTGYACKGRVDGITPSYIADLKTARDIVRGKFQRDAAGYLYHGQVAWYHDGSVTAGKIDGSEPPYVIAVETEAPFDVIVCQMTPEELTAGRVFYRQLLGRLRACIETDTWPGAYPDVEPLDLPHWAPGMQESEGF